MDEQLWVVKSPNDPNSYIIEAHYLIWFLLMYYTETEEQENNHGS